MKYVLTPENSDPQEPRYEPYGIVLTKKWAYQKGCGPVLYLSNQEMVSLRIPDQELWRVIRFDMALPQELRSTNLAGCTTEVIVVTPQ